MICYKLRSDKLFHEEMGNYIAYGMDIIDYETDSLIRSIPDISTEKAALERLIRQCNQLHADIIHIDDIIEDFLL